MEVPAQVCVKFRGRTYNGVINAVPEGPAPGGRQGPRHTGSGYMDTAAGLSSVMSGYHMFCYVQVCLLLYPHNVHMIVCNAIEYNIA